jgi:hypothetical protein
LVAQAPSSSTAAAILARIAILLIRFIVFPSTLQ